jgi:small GTP-binding protein
MFSYKLVTIGDAGCGKTALTMRYANGFYGNTEMTIGVDFAIKKFEDGSKVQIWDTAGQESFRSISRSYYRGAQGVLIIFDLSNAKSFINVKNWFNEFKEANQNAICVLVGTKADKMNVISKEEIDEMVKYLDIKYFETSAKNNENVSQPFEYLIKNIIPAEKKEVIVENEKENCCKMM